MKLTIAILLLITLSQAQFLARNGNRENEQAFLDGFYNGIGLPSPSTIMPCVDDTTVGQIADFAPKALDEACHLSLVNINKLVNEIQAFIDGLNPNVGKCLEGNAEVVQLLNKLGTLDPAKILAYVTTHFNAVKKSVCGIESAWKGGQYSQSGAAAMVLVKQILGIKGVPELEVDSSKDTLQAFMNGLFETAGLPDPKTVLDCGDDATADKIAKFVPVALDKACHLNVGNIQSFIDYIQKFIDSLPPSVGQCLEKNAEIIALLDKVGPLDPTKIIAYVTLHFLQVRSSVCDIEGTWNKGDYKEAGVASWKLIKKVVGTELGSPKDNEQQFLNGFYQEIGLPAPTTIMPCVDDDSASKINAFAPKALHDACHLEITNVNKFIDELKAFQKTLNPNVAKCLEGNSEVAALVKKLGKIDESKIIAYVTTHFGSIKKAFCNIESIWNGGKYSEAGKTTMDLVKKILGLKLEDPLEVDAYLRYQEFQNINFMDEIEYRAITIDEVEEIEIIEEIEY